MSQPSVMYPEKREAGSNGRNLNRRNAAAVAASAILKTNLGFKMAKHPEAVSVKPASYIHIKPDTSLQQVSPKTELPRKKHKMDESSSESEDSSENESEDDEEYFSTESKAENTPEEEEAESESEDDGERVQFESSKSDEEDNSEEVTEPHSETNVPAYKVLDINEDPNDKGSRPNSTIIKSWATGTRSPRGLLNTGVTCYMNAAIQSMVHVPPLANFLMDVHKGKYQQISKTSVTKELASLYHKMLDPNITRHIYPAAIIRRLDDINPLMSMWQQEDSHEYFMSLLSRVQEDTVPPGKKLRTSILHEIFGGTYEQKVTCQTCKTVSTTHQDFYDMPVSFSAKERKDHNKFTLQRSIKDFFSPAVIKPEKNNSGGYECEKCKTLTTAITVSLIEEPSEYLPINIKRFNFREKSSRKIKDGIYYPMELDLTEYSVNPKIPLKYKLISVTLHEGRTTSSGHYVAFCNQPNNTWSLYDDETVRRVNEKAVLRQQEAAYFLVYARLTPVEISAQHAAPTFVKSSTTANGKALSSKKPKDNDLKTTDNTLRRTQSMSDIKQEETNKSDEEPITSSFPETPSPSKKSKKNKHHHTHHHHSHGLKHSKSLSTMKSPASKNGDNSPKPSPHAAFARLSDKLYRRRQDKKRARESLTSHGSNSHHKKASLSSSSPSKANGVSSSSKADQIVVKKRKLDSEIDKIFESKSFFK